MKPSIPKDFAVQPLKPGQTAVDRVTCGTCGLSWDDGVPTAWTPAPSGRCPFEYLHVSAEPIIKPIHSPIGFALTEVTQALSRLASTPGLDEPLVRETLAIRTAFDSRRQALLSMQHGDPNTKAFFGYPLIKTYSYEQVLSQAGYDLLVEIRRNKKLYAAYAGVEPATSDLKKEITHALLVLANDDDVEMAKVAERLRGHHAPVTRAAPSEDVVVLKWVFAGDTIQFRAPLWWAACFGPSSVEPGRVYWKIHSGAGGKVDTEEQAVTCIKEFLKEDTRYAYEFPIDDANLNRELELARMCWKRKRKCSEYKP